MKGVSSTPDDRFQVHVGDGPIHLGGDFTTAGQALDFALKVRGGEIDVYRTYRTAPLQITRVQYVPQFSVVTTLQ